MRLAVGMLVLLSALGCTKSNPAKHCDDGTCIDPNYPFCDVSGAIAGEPGACIATACTADQFIECRGDVEVRCNADGSNYNLTPCDRGCDAAADGCHLCSPGETACTNGQVATCDATGSIVAKETCPLGCFGTEPRCTEIDPSNGLGMYFDMVPSPPALDYEDLGFDTGTGTVTDQSTGTSVLVPNFLVSAPPNGVAIRVFVVESARITRLASSSDLSHTGTDITGPAFALLSRGDIQITGIVSAGPSAGGSLAPGCVGGHGRIRDACDYSSSGGGGGAFGTNGARGGAVTNNSEDGGAAGIAAGTDKLVPLRGGCAGGGVDDDVGTYWNYGGGGGGAVQLVSRTRITVDGIVDVGGVHGDSEQYQQFYGWPCFGGGAGGAILLEAPTISLDVNAQIIAKGGDGCEASTLPNAMYSTGGKGAHAGIAATPGTDTTCAANGKPTVAGAGGGGLGRVRINTKDGTYTTASTAAVDASLTSGTIGTR